MLAHGWQIVPERGVVTSREPFKFWRAPTISLEWLKLEWSICTHVTSSPSTWVTNHPWKGRGQGHVTNFIFCSPNDISGTAKARVVKFCTQVDYIKSELSPDKAPLQEAWWPIFIFDGRDHIPGMAEARVANFCIQNGRGQGHVTCFLKMLPQSYLWNRWNYNQCKCRVLIDTE